MSRNWPIYFKERLWLVNPEKGFVGVATLWTPKERIARLMPENVSVVGQLYTKGGIEFIIRNLWAKPQISYLVVCGQDSSDSGVALREFFQKGTIGGRDPLFDKYIPKRDLKIIREKVQLVNFCGQTDPALTAKKISKLKFRPAFAKKPKLFPQAKLPGTFPSETSVFRIEAPTIGLAWLEILKTILRFGWELPRLIVYGGKERMILNLAVVITEEEIKKPKIYPFFNFDEKQLKKYFKEFFNPKRGDQAYTYGERLFDYFGVDQVGIMAQKLHQFPFNKGALATLWQPTIDNFPQRQPWHTPCLTLIQGICQEEKLHLTAYFRSNDMFGAWLLNAFALRRLQAVLAEKIDKEVGVLTVVSHSAFIDNNDLPAAQKVVEENDRLFCLWDPRGNLVIDVQGEEIVVQHFSPNGGFLQEFRVNGKKPKAASQMAEKLIKAQVISRADHALDIGEQLARAEEAIKLGLRFEQDKNLKKVWS